MCRWKEEMSHDPNFVPSAVPNDIRKEFQAYCDSFDIEKVASICYTSRAFYMH